LLASDIDIPIKNWRILLQQSLKVHSHWMRCGATRRHALCHSMPQSAALYTASHDMTSHHDIMSLVTMSYNIL